MPGYLETEIVRMIAKIGDSKIASLTTDGSNSHQFQPSLVEVTEGAPSEVKFSSEVFPFLVSIQSEVLLNIQRFEVSVRTLDVTESHEKLKADYDYGLKVSFITIKEYEELLGNISSRSYPQKPQRLTRWLVNLITANSQDVANYNAFKNELHYVDANTKEPKVAELSFGSVIIETVIRQEIEDASTPDWFAVAQSARVTVKFRYVARNRASNESAKGVVKVVFDYAVSRVTVSFDPFKSGERSMILAVYEFNMESGELFFERGENESVRSEGKTKPYEVMKPLVEEVIVTASDYAFAGMNLAIHSVLM
jgi:hypothetical protein